MKQIINEETLAVVDKFLAENNKRKTVEQRVLLAAMYEQGLKDGKGKNLEWHSSGESPKKFHHEGRAGWKYAKILIINESGSISIHNVFEGEKLPPHAKMWLDIDSVLPHGL